MRKTAIVIGVILAFTTASFAADVYIKQKSHQDAMAMANQPAKDQIQDIWIADNKMAMHNPDMSIVINLDIKKMYWINHKGKNYVEMDLPLDLTKYFPPQMAQMMSGLTVTVNPTGETKTIGKWKCDGYDVSINIMMMDMKQKIWSSTDVPFDWQAYNDKMLPNFMQAMTNMGGEAFEEFKKIKGFQIRTDMTMSVMGNDMKNWTEVEEITKKSAPAGTYDPPAGYTKKDKIDMMGM